MRRACRRKLAPSAPSSGAPVEGWTRSSVDADAVSVPSTFPVPSLSLFPSDATLPDEPPTFTSGHSTSEYCLRCVFALDGGA